MSSGRVGRWRFTAPAESARPWLAWGLLIQLLGVSPIAVVMWRSVRSQSLGGHITAEMIKFAWHSELHTRAGLVILVGGSVLYAAGSVVMARPYISRPVTLFVAVPVASVAGLLVLGVLVLAIALLFAALQNGDLDFGIDFPDRARRSRRRGP